MELVKVGEKTYYIKNPTNIGIYKINDTDIYLIDTGNDKEAGKKILKIIDDNGWNVIGIINTHSNADHIGGNKIIQDRTNCVIYGYAIEKCFTEYPILEPSFLYGGYPNRDLQNKFLMAKESIVTNISNNLPDGLEFFTIKGHFFDMIGIKTSDNIYFLGDSLFSQETINKYNLFFIYNVEEYLKTLDYLQTLNGRLFIPSHTNVTNDISSLIDANKNKIQEIIEKIYNICEEDITGEDILKYLFDEYNLSLNMEQYVLCGSTVRSYLSYMYDNNMLEYDFINNKMIWRQKNEGN